jgi:hypothetical protein
MLLPSPAFAGLPPVRTDRRKRGLASTLTMTIILIGARRRPRSVRFVLLE